MTILREFKEKELGREQTQTQKKQREDLRRKRKTERIGQETGRTK